MQIFSRMCLVVTSVVVLSAGAIAGPAAPQNSEKPSTDEARKLFDASRECLAREDYDCALRNLNAAFALAPLPLFKYDLGVVYAHLGRLAEAKQSFEDYLENASASSSKRADAVARLAEINHKLPQASPDASAGGTASATTNPAPVPQLRSDGAGAPPVAARLVPAPRTGSAAVGGVLRPWYNNPAGWTLLGVGVAGLAVGSGLLGESASLNGRVGESSSEGSLNSTHDGVDTYRTAGIATLAAGGALSLVGSIVLIVATRHSPRVVSRFHVATESGITVPLGGGW